MKDVGPFHIILLLIAAYLFKDAIGGVVTSSQANAVSNLGGVVSQNTEAVSGVQTSVDSGNAALADTLNKLVSGQNTQTGILAGLTDGLAGLSAQVQGVEGRLQNTENRLQNMELKVDNLFNAGVVGNAMPTTVPFVTQ